MTKLAKLIIELEGRKQVSAGLRTRPTNFGRCWTSVITGFRDERRPTISFELTGGNVLGVDRAAGCAVFRTHGVAIVSILRTVVLLLLESRPILNVIQIFIRFSNSKKLDLCNSKYMIDRKYHDLIKVIVIVLSRLVRT